MAQRSGKGHAPGALTPEALAEIQAGAPFAAQTPVSRSQAYQHNQTDLEFLRVTAGRAPGAGT